MGDDNRLQSLSRREFVRNAALGAGGILLSASALAARDSEADYAPFRMGIQSYSLRGYPVEEALAKTRDFGLTWWEAFPNHLPMTDDPEKIKGYKALLKKYNIRLFAYGVVDFHNDDADMRKKFNFAKAMGIQTLSAYPTPDSLALLDVFTQEYKINIAIHNHGPGDHLYARVAQEVAALKGHGKRVGVCCDTGHYLRSNEDPVEAVRVFGTHVFDMHLKDVMDGPNGEKMFTEIGKGNLKTVEILRILKANGYPKRGILALEYEEHEHDPDSYIRECLAATREAIRKVNS